MKRYMVWWGALFFLVMFTSLYLMLETVTNPKTSDLQRSQMMEDIEDKIQKIEGDLAKNKELISDIKAWVRLLAKGDNKALDHLVKLVGGKDELTKHLQEAAEKPLEVFQVSPGERIPLSGSMCMSTVLKKLDTDIDMHAVFDALPFDNVDGGVWKQGWDVTYDKAQWNHEKLKIFVVPHTHCDPGWIKTLIEYYKQQTRNIFENMLTKLELDSRRKFIFAEISYFSLWWDELDSMRRDRVRKLIDHGQLEFVTGGWVMTDEANAHYFAMIDQLLEGHQWLNGTLGVKPKNGWAIDPFGYSSTMAYLLKRTGFQNMLIQRVHYSIKKYLAQQRNLEFMWRQQWDNQKSTDIFCHMMPFYSYDVPHTCGPDPKVCCQFDFRRLPGNKYHCPWKIPPVVITDHNVAERAALLLDQYRKKAQLYKTNVVLAPLGDDFRYDRPEEWDYQYNNYQKLFDFINTHPELGAQAQFGTLSDYFDAVNKSVGSSHPFSTLMGDFFTYADRDDNYWSGYFTSRPFHKNLDRVLEASLRSAEVIFSLAQAYARKNTASNFPSVEMMKKLVTARRGLGLFQHHDAITGTAKDFVVNDYGNRLLEGLTGSKQVIAESAAFLAAENKVLYKYNADSPILLMDDMREHHDSLPQKPVIRLDSQPVPVVLYNSLGHRRVQLVTVWTSHPSVEVQDSDGNVVHCQTEPHWHENNISPDMTKFKVSFVAEIPALGLAVYKLRRVVEGDDIRNHWSSITFINTKSETVDSDFPIRFETSSKDFRIKNAMLEAKFSGATGLLKSVKVLATGKVHRLDLRFALYDERKYGEKSGAYLFLPEGNGLIVTDSNPLIRVSRGPMVSEVHVFTKYVHHVVRLINTAGIDGVSLDIHNVVDIHTIDDREISLRMHTDINNEDHVFFTDLNGFQMQRRQTYQKLPLQGNVYPMSTSVFIQNSVTRFSVLTAQALGVHVLKPGLVDIMLDRRLLSDDGRGLMQGVIDNRKTPNQFRLLFESRDTEADVSSVSVAYPSLLSHIASLHLTQPVYAMPLNTEHLADAPVFMPKFSPLAHELPCEIHLVNLRTLQNRDDNAEIKYIPRELTAMLLHHMGSDCSFPLHSTMCLPNDGKVHLSQMFKDLSLNDLHETSLTLMHDHQNLAGTEEYSVPPMEIKAFKTSLW